MKTEKIKMADRFANLREQEIEALLQNVIPDNTKKTTRYGIKIFNGKY